MDRQEIIRILEGEVREAKGIAKIQAIKLLLEEQRRDGDEDQSGAKQSKIDQLAEKRARRAA